MSQAPIASLCFSGIYCPLPTWNGSSRKAPCCCLVLDRLQVGEHLSNEWTSLKEASGPESPRLLMEGWKGLLLLLGLGGTAFLAAEATLPYGTVQVSVGLGAPFSGHCD